MTPFTTDNIPGALPAYIEVYMREDNEYDWRLIALNHEIVCSSLQGFTSRGDATRAAEHAMDLMAAAPEMRQV